MPRLIAMLLLATVAAGCRVGPRLDNYAPAQHPHGVAAQLQTGSGAVRGELLEVQDTALLLLAPERALILVPYSQIREGSFGPAGVDISGTPSLRAQERLRTFSRYPQGLSPELRRQLLAAYGQAELRVITQ